MAKIYPFKGTYYNKDKVTLGDVLSPPYDVINEEQGKALLAKSPYNFAHIILKKDGGNYQKVKERLDKWEETGVLQTDKEPGLYIYQQSFEALGKTHTRNTLLCSVELADFSEGIVRPHELTHKSPVGDRLQILKDTQTNLSCIFAMVKDRKGVLQGEFEKVTFNPPILSDKTEDGVSHSLWKIPEEQAAPIISFFESESVYIVDGHHRYTSALAYAKEQGCVGADKEASRMFFAIANAFDPALIVFPTHRLVKQVVLDEAARKALTENYEVTAIQEEDLKEFITTPVDKPTFVIGYQREFLKCSPLNPETKSSEWGKSVASLSVAWSDNVFLEQVCSIKKEERGDRVEYHKEFHKMFENAQASDLCLILPPIEVQAILDVADEEKFMPQKTTFFYPKIAAGILLRSLREDG